MKVLLICPRPWPFLTDSPESILFQTVLPPVLKGIYNESAIKKEDIQFEFLQRKPGENEDAFYDKLRTSSGISDTAGIIHLFDLPAGNNLCTLCELKDEHPFVCVLAHNTAEFSRTGVYLKKNIKRILLHLINEGYSRIGLFCAGDEPEKERELEFYFKKMMKFKDLEIVDEYIFSAAARTSVYPDRFDQYFSRDPLPEVIVCSSGITAMYLQLYAEEHSINIPGDVAVCSTEYFPSYILYPRLFNAMTNIRPNYFEIGRLGFYLLYEIMTDRKSNSGESVLVPGKVDVRKSTKREKRGRPLNQDWFVQQINMYLETDPETICINTGSLALKIADTLNMSKKYFQLKFKKIFRRSFTDFLNIKRVERAAYLLRFTDKSILQLLLEVGFNSHQSFLYAFKKIYGMSPAEYRDSILPGDREPPATF